MTGKIVTYSLHSEKYSIDAKLVDCHIKMELQFQYKEQERVIAVRRPRLGSETENIYEFGLSILESCIENLFNDSVETNKASLHYWYITKEKVKDKQYLVAHGRVSGHQRLEDSILIHTSAIQWISINNESEEAIIQTRNTTYHCRLEYCDFNEQDSAPNIVPYYEMIKEKYHERRQVPTIAEDNVLLVLSNFDFFYFHNLFYRKAGKTKPEKYSANPHIGTFQDTFIIKTSNGAVDIRYFPHYRNIELYSAMTDGKPFFAKNIGTVTLYINSEIGTIKLEPGEMKEICKSSEIIEPMLPKGDLYPAGIVCSYIK